MKKTMGRKSRAIVPLKKSLTSQMYNPKNSPQARAVRSQ